MAPSLVLKSPTCCGKEWRSSGIVTGIYQSPAERARTGIARHFPSLRPHPTVQWPKTSRSAKVAARGGSGDFPLWAIPFSLSRILVFLVFGVFLLCPSVLYACCLHARGGACLPECLEGALRSRDLAILRCLHPPLLLPSTFTQESASLPALGVRGYLRDGQVHVACSI